MYTDKDKDKDQRKSETQEEILHSALKLFTEQGYFNTSLTDIKEQVGAKTTSTIYQHFKNKQAIASMLYAIILDSLNCSIDDIRRRNKKPSDQLREIVDLMFVLTDEAPEVMQFLLLVRIDEFLPDEKPLLQTEPYEKIKKIIQAGIKTKEIKPIDPVQAFAYFFGVINQTLTMVLIGDLDKKADTYQTSTWVTAWKTIAKK